MISFDYRTRLIRDYVIFEDTFALMPVDRNHTYVIEKYQTLYVKGNIRQVLNYNCNLRGATLSGAQKAARTILDTHSPVPIIVDSRNDLFFFPTASIINHNNLWINLDSFIGVHENNIVFKNGFTVKTCISKSKVIQQFLKAMEYRMLLKKEVIYSKSNEVLSTNHKFDLQVAEDEEM